MTMDYRLIDGADGKELATGSTTLVAFDYHEHKTITVPDDWRKKIHQYERGE
jgi:acyl-CoA thioesterase FadM